MATSADVLPSGNHTATVFFLHGLGDTGHGWAAGFDGIREDYIRYSCPHAPIQAVTLNAGFKMPSWFDIYALNFEGPEDEAGLKEASKKLQQLVDDEVKKGVPTERIILGGFSQGGAVALHAALTTQKRLGGCIVLSSWLPMHEKIAKEIKGDKSFPVFHGHGDADPMVALQFGKMTGEALKKFFPNYTFKVYNNVGHSSCPEEMRDVQAFIKTAVPKL